MVVVVVVVVVTAARRSTVRLWLCAYISHRTTRPDKFM